MKRTQRQHRPNLVFSLQRQGAQTKTKIYAGEGEGLRVRVDVVRG